MHTSFRTSLLLLAGLAVGVSSCKKDTDPGANTLIGSWQLTNRSCYCAPAALPNERLVFTDTNMLFFVNDSLAATNPYVRTTAPACNGAAEPVVQITVTTGPRPYTQTAVYTVNGNLLTLNHNTSCLADAPVNTYRRQP